MKKLSLSSMLAVVCACSVVACDKKTDTANTATTTPSASAPTETTVATATPDPGPEIEPPSEDEAVGQAAVQVKKSNYKAELGNLEKELESLK